MKHLILMNPTRRRRGGRRKLYGAAARAHARKIARSGRRRTTRATRSTRRRRRTRVVHVVRRNPVARRRSGGRSHSPAMRRKISLAVKAANRRRSGGVVRRSYSAVRRRFSRGGGGGGISLSNPFKAIFSKQTLWTAGGAVASSFVTQYILSRYSAQLPLANQLVGRVAYKLIIPFAGAVAAKKINRDFASGMIIGGAVMAINEIIAAYATPRVAGAVAPMKSYGQEYDGEADFATDTYMGSVGEGGMPSALGEEEALGEYFEGADSPFDSAPAFKNEF